MSSTTNSAAGSLSPASGTQTSDQSRSLPSPLLSSAEPDGRLGELAARHGDESPGFRELGAAGKTLRDTIARSHLEELARHAIGEENPAGLIEIDHAGGDVLDDALDQPLLAQQLVAALGDLARHAIDRLGERRELEHRGLDAERGGASGDPLRARHDLHDRPGERARQPRPERGEQEEDRERGEQRPAADERRLCRRLLLLRQQGHRKEQARLSGIEAGHGERRVELQILGAAGSRRARGLVLATERHARPDLAGNPPRQESGSEELPLARGVDLAPPVEAHVVSDDPREPDQNLVVDRRAETESGLEREHVLSQHALGGRERRLGGGTAARARRDSREFARAIRRAGRAERAAAARRGGSAGWRRSASCARGDRAPLRGAGRAGSRERRASPPRTGLPQRARRRARAPPPARARARRAPRRRRHSRAAGHARCPPAWRSSRHLPRHDCECRERRRRIGVRRRRRHRRYSRRPPRAPGRAPASPRARERRGSRLRASRAPTPGRVREVRSIRRGNSPGRHAAARRRDHRALQRRRRIPDAAPSRSARPPPPGLHPPADSGPRSVRRARRAARGRSSGPARDRGRARRSAADRRRNSRVAFPAARSTSAEIASSRASGEPRQST